MDGSSRRPVNRHFAPGREFSLIEALFDESHFSSSGEGLGDDGYLLRIGGETLAVSTDCSVEGIHYRLDWDHAPGALAKALLSNLSDINAMGGRATLAFLTLGALEAWDEGVIVRLGEAIRRLESEHGFRVVGGDTVRKPSESFFSFTVLGPVRGRPLLRSNARPGHGIFVSGTLGGSAAGLCLLDRGFRAGSEAGLDGFIRAHLEPSPPLRLGPYLAGLPGPVSAIDLSDGLSSELWHLSRQSGCRMRVEWGKLPYERGLAHACGDRSGLWKEWVLHGGEEYQLLFTGDFTAADLEGMSEYAKVTRIGRVDEGDGVVVLDETGAETELPPGGWTH